MKKAISQVKEIIYKNVPTFFILVIIGILVYVPLWFFTIHLSYIEESSVYSASLPVLGSDSLEYSTLALNLIETGCFTMNDCYNPDTFRTPGYPFFVAIIVFIFKSLFAVTFIQILLTLFTGFLVFQILSKYVSKRLSTYGMIIFLLEPSVVLHSLFILSDTPYVFLITLSFYLITKKEPKCYEVSISGLLLGLSVLFRPISIFLLPVFIFIYFYLFFKTKKDLLKNIFLLSIFFLISFLPWSYRNYLNTGVFSLSSVSSYNLVYYNVPMFISYRDGVNEGDVRNEISTVLSLETETWLDLKNSKDLNSIAKEYITSDLFGYTKFHLLKTISFFFGSSLKNSFYVFESLLGVDTSSYNTQSISNVFLKGNFLESLKELSRETLFLLERILWLFVMVFSLFGVFSKSYRKITLILWVIILYFAIMTGPVSYVRYRLPIEPFIFMAFILSLDYVYGYYLKLKNNI